MTSPPTLSVAVATMNRPEALARCLDAILAGTMMPAEIIVIDQGDTREAEVVARDRDRGRVPVVYLRQDASGLSASRNAAAGLAGGDLLAVTDDDCVPGTGWVAALASAFATAPAPDAVTGRVLGLGGERPGTHAVSLRTSTTPADFVGAHMPWDVGTGANFAVWRDRLARVGGYDERLGAGAPGMAAEDLELLHRLLASGARIRYEPDAVVYHERQSDARRLFTRWAYGHGIGAACGMLLRRGDRLALTVLSRWLAGRGVRLAGAAARLDGFAVRQGWLSLAGAVRGLVYGWRAERPGAPGIAAWRGP